MRIQCRRSSSLTTNYWSQDRCKQRYLAEDRTARRPEEEGLALRFLTDATHSSNAPCRNRKYELVILHRTADERTKSTLLILVYAYEGGRTGERSGFGAPIFHYCNWNAGNVAEQGPEDWIDPVSWKICCKNVDFGAGGGLERFAEERERRAFYP